QIQILLLYLILIYSRKRGIKIVWFVHNNESHNGQKRERKKRIINLMIRNSNVILSHSKELIDPLPKYKYKSFPHPIEERDFVENAKEYQYDLLIWGKMSQYKGVLEFLKYNFKSDDLNTHKILVIGRFTSEKDYEEANKY